MKRTMTACAALWLAALLPAQAGDAANKEARAAYDKFQADWSKEQATARAAAQAVQESDAYKQAREAKDNDRLRELSKDVKRADSVSFGRRALALADQYGEAGMPFLTFVAENVGDKQLGQELVKRIDAKWLDSASLGDLLEAPYALQAAIGPDDTKALLSRIAEHNKNALPRAWAFYWQASLINRDKKASDEDKAAAKKMMEDATVLAGNSMLGERLNAPAFEKEHLQIGMQAPEVIGDDLDGVTFKLSDYRGKVVVLDFWGFW